ncbi:GTP-binding protein, partial [Acetobacterium sp. UBA5834]|uniref:GTP-binding protein n=1 Tax=Acetobacterium sp. UBA5834 TaxID=1945907 RepID=UPI00257D7931
VAFCKRLKVIVLGGFLGSGKTSVLLQLAEFLVARSLNNENTTPVVIVENEIGGSGVDNLLLENQGLTVKNLFAGCACCTSSAQLEDTVSYLKKEFDPQWLVIEATGLAYPDKIKQTIEDAFLVETEIITIIDAKRWFRLIAAMEPFVSGQLENASSVLINKVDTVDEQKVQSVIESIQTYNKKLPCYPISAIIKIPDDFWERLLDQRLIAL